MKALIAGIVLLGSSITAFGQDAPRETYKISPEDVLHVQIFGEQQVNIDLPVGQDGNISAPFAGTFHVEGKTPAEVEVELAKAYKEKLKMRDPKVSVVFTFFHPRRATISGAVGRANQYQFRDGDTIMTLVAMGGDVGDGADLHRAMLRRRDSNEVIPLDLYAMLRKGDMSQNYKLKDGDELSVPIDLVRNSIRVLGFIQRPGSFAFREPMTLADAISQAGGEIPGKSRMSKVTILRQQPGAPGTFIQIQADFVRFTNKGDASQNIELQPNDFVYVPATNTPDINTIANTVNSAFFIDNILRNGIFGLRLFH